MSKRIAPCIAASAYARPSSASAAPESNRPALKKYGLTRPDFSVNSPKRSALRWRARSRKARWDSSMGRVVRDEGRGRAMIGRLRGSETDKKGACLSYSPSKRPRPSSLTPHLSSLLSMRIITFNANGIRSAANKGFFDWLRKQKADIVCLQETKAQEEQLTDPAFRPDGHHVFYRDATTKKGYSGVGIIARREPDEVRTSIGWAPFDDEGRYLEARFGNLSVVSLYVPSGSSGEERQQFKFKVMEWFKPVLDGWLASGRDYVLCGDWNIVRSQLDIKNWTSNQKNSGCLPAERDWLNGVCVDERGWVDSY